MLSKDVPVRAWTSFADISHETALQAFVGLTKWWGEKKGQKDFMSDITSTSASLCASITRRMVKAILGPYWPIGGHVREISSAVTGHTPEDGPRLQNDALAKAIILIQNTDSEWSHLPHPWWQDCAEGALVWSTCSSAGGQGGWLPPSLLPLPLLITLEGSSVKLIK